MRQNKRETPENNFRLQTNALKGKQSVRATFRLPQQAIDLLRVVAGQLGIKQKSLFDQLIENIPITGQEIHNAQESGKEETNRRQKTFVISRSSLVLLNDIVKQQQISRDILVEFSIKRLLPIIESEREKHNKRKEVLSEMKEYLQQGKRLLQMTENQLGTDDLVYDMIKKQVRLSEKNVAELNTLIERGMPMEQW